MFSGGIKYKGFDLSVLFQGVAQRDIYLRGASVYSFQNNGTASNLALDSWTTTNPNASYPRLLQSISVITIVLLPSGEGMEASLDCVIYKWDMSFQMPFHMHYASVRCISM